MRIVLAAALVAWAAIASASADEAEYGPDWPVCRNLGAPPRIRIETCNRLIDGGKLSQLHLAWAYNHRGTAWHDLGQIDLAEQDYIQSGKIWPTGWKSFFNLGNLYSEMGKFDDALKQFDRVFEIAPDAPRAQCNRGAMLEKLNRFEEAASAYEQAVQISPADACSIKQLVGIYSAQDRLPDILAMIERAIAATGGGTAELYRVRADVYRLRTREFELALADLHKAVALDPGGYENLRSRGVVLTELGRYEEASADLNQAVAMAPRFSDGYAWRAKLELRMGSYRAAYDDYQRCVALEPSHSWCQRGVMQSAFLVGDFATAARFAEGLEQPFYSNAPLHAGVAKFAGGDLGAAAAAIGAYAKAQPGDPYGWLWLALVNRRQGREVPAELKEAAEHRTSWPTPVLRHMAGLATAEDVLAAADVPDPDIKRQRIAEANFYLGELAAIDGDEVKSKAYLQASVAAGYSEIDPLNSIPVFKEDNALEVGLAAVALRGNL
jgi:tetratricopeptide (TPR) repeat protein